MIITQTPFRVSLAGGGTDLPAFYKQSYGAVLSFAIQKHMYITVHKRFESGIRISYSKTEDVKAVEDLEHTIVREALKMTGLSNHLEVTTIADVPAGTGMGSSSSLSVGLLNALYAYNGQLASRSKLAHEACEIEINRLESPIGKQDQYAAAFGGVNYIKFNSSGSVDVEPVPIKEECIEKLQSEFLLLYTNTKRDANQILEKQSKAAKDQTKILTEMRDLADAMRQSLLNDCDLNQFGQLLHQGWELKRSLGHGISNPAIDDWYSEARKLGARGGKLLGAGGGGYLLLMAPPDKHSLIREKLQPAGEIDFEIDRNGSRIVFISD